MIHYRYDKARQLTAPILRPTAGSLLSEVLLAIRLSGSTESRFGRAAINDPTLVQRMRGGAVLHARTVERVKAHLRQMASQREVAHA